MIAARFHARRGLPSDLVLLLQPRTNALRSIAGAESAPRPRDGRLRASTRPRLFSTVPPPSFSDSAPENPPTPSSHSSAPQDLPSDPTTPILRAALLAVPRLGWSDAALRHGAAETGLPTVSASGLFPRGPVQLVEYFLATALDEAGREMSGMDVSKMGTTQKIRLGCVTRLEKTMPYAETWHEAIALLVLPGNVLSASLHLANLANVIWNFAGDQANDVSWYTKSAMLGAVYSSTELFMVEDKSPGRAETKAFLDRRLADVEALGSLRSEVESVLGFVARSLAGAAEAHGLIKR